MMCRTPPRAAGPTATQLHIERCQYECVCMLTGFPELITLLCNHARKCGRGVDQRMGECGFWMTPSIRSNEFYSSHYSYLLRDSLVWFQILTSMQLHGSQGAFTLYVLYANIVLYSICFMMTQPVLPYLTKVTIRVLEGAMGRGQSHIPGRFIPLCSRFLKSVWFTHAI